MNGRGNGDFPLLFTPPGATAPAQSNDAACGTARRVVLHVLLRCISSRARHAPHPEKARALAGCGKKITPASSRCAPQAMPRSRDHQSRGISSCQHHDERPRTAHDPTRQSLLTTARRSTPSAAAPSARRTPHDLVARATLPVLQGASQRAATDGLGQGGPPPWVTPAEFDLSYVTRSHGRWLIQGATPAQLRGLQPGDRLVQAGRLEGRPARAHVRRQGHRAELARRRPTTRSEILFGLYKPASGRTPTMATTRRTTTAMRMRR